MRQGSLAVGIVAVLLVAAPAHAHDGLAPKLGPAAKAAAVAADPAKSGDFGDPFAEPTIGGRLTGAKCITDANDVTICKPAAGSVTVLASGKVASPSSRA